jgi:hypothetical protein
VVRTLRRLFGRRFARLGALDGPNADVGDVILERSAAVFGATRHAGEACSVASDCAESEEGDECFSFHVRFS